MLLTVDIKAKTIGNKELFRDLRFSIEPRQKVAVIGRNGVGKTTLFHMLTGEDTDFTGELRLKRGMRLVSTAQEHHHVGDETVVGYVLHNLPRYKELQHIIQTYPDIMGDNLKKIDTYTNALEQFNERNYYTIEGDIVRSLAAYQISETVAFSPMSNLSGGQKRFVELVRIEHADADIVLIDEPTNHMDYAAKATFINWLKAAPHTVLVITHDRDVLKWVDKIVEIKDAAAHTFKGNYEAYLRQNAATTAAHIHDYQVGLKTLDNLHRKILWARARKPSWHGTADQRNPFEVMERRLQKEYDTIKSTMVKPSFWIDRESVEGLTKKMSENYTKFKAKNIRIKKTDSDTHASELVKVEGVQLGYGGQPLFAPLDFSMRHGERRHVVGRNGAGKTTLIRAIVAASHGVQADTVLAGRIACGSTLRLSVYEQEVGLSAMKKSLAEAIEDIYHELDMPVNDELVKRVMSDYLFDPQQDGRLLVEQLSGGQKARLQVIKMLAHNPNMLILDEPTNHLDLPSIEELENALMRYHGALLYVSHDSYFAANIGGDETLLQSL